MITSKIMKKIFITLSLILALSSCSIDWKWEKDKKIAELEKQVSELKKEQENDLFEKQQKCLDYKNEIEKDLLEKEKKSQDKKYSLEQLFYSSKINKCYFVSISNTETSTEKWLYEYWNHSLYSESIDSCNYYYDENFTKIDNGCQRLNKKIKELKWE